MTSTINIGTSPLQAAREWRGHSLIAAARAAGLHAVQVEALEAGDIGAFDNMNEMVAAAVVYGASLGIGRDEAVALLDRVVEAEANGISGSSDGSSPAPTSGTSTFSAAVSERTARIESRQVPVMIPVSDYADVPGAPVAGTPVNAAAAGVAVGSEIEIDKSFGPAPKADESGELEQWVAQTEGPAADAEPSGFATRVGNGSFAVLERVVGTERADKVADQVEAGAAKTVATIRTGREKLRQSEHATLIVAIVGGALLIALLVAISSSFGGNDAATETPAGDTPANRIEPAAPNTAGAAKNNQAKTPAKNKAAAPIVAPAKITVNVFNAGRVKGKANQVADSLKAKGYKLGEVGNTQTSYPSSTVLYPKALQREAKRLATQTGIGTLDQAPGTGRTITVVVV